MSDLGDPAKVAALLALLAPGFIILWFVVEGYKPVKKGHTPKKVLGGFTPHASSGSKPPSGGSGVKAPKK